MALPLVVVGCMIVLKRRGPGARCRNTTASGADNAASPDWQTLPNGIISPSERG